MKSTLYNQKGTKTGDIQLPKEVFGVKVNSELIHQTVLYYESIQRKQTAKTKDRSEVRGGGKKPWKQKGTGRSRHGSRRSPIWKGGGVAFGPTGEKKYEKKINKKMAKKALFGVLSGKLKEEEIIFVEKIDVSDNKTKSVSAIVNNISKIKKDIKKNRTIFILAKKNEKFLQGSKNIKNLFTIPSNSLNVYFILKARYLVIEKEAVKNIK